MGYSSENSIRSLNVPAKRERRIGSAPGHHLVRKIQYRKEELLGGGRESQKNNNVAKNTDWKEEKGINGDMSAVMEGRTQSLSRHLSCLTKQRGRGGEGGGQEYVECKQFPDFLDNLPSSNGVPTGLERTESQRAGFKSGTFPSNSLSFRFPATIWSPISSQSQSEEQGGARLTQK